MNPANRPQPGRAPAAGEDAPPDSGDSPRTFRGHDPDTGARPAIATATPTKCQARTRLYRDGTLVSEGFPVDQISDYLTDDTVVIWLDLRDPDRDDLAVLSEEFGLHPLAIEDAVHERERPKLDRYRSHLFLTAYGAKLDTDTGELATSELAAFITRRALLTVRKVHVMDLGAHVLRAADWTDSLRDLVTTILETNLTIQGNRMNIITKKVTSWAAIIAVPTFITGFYGMNVPYPGFGHTPGLISSVSIMIVSGLVLYRIFKRSDWL